MCDYSDLKDLDDPINFHDDIDDERKVECLQFWAANGFEEKLNEYLSQLKDASVADRLLSSYNSDGWNCIMQAARHGHTSTLSLILNYCTTLNAKTKLGSTALSCATRSGHLSTVKLLLDKEATICDSSQEEVTPLMVAAQHGYEAIVTELIERGCDVNFKSKSSGLTALMLATLNGHLPTVKILLAKGADISIKNAADMTALDIAAYKRRKKLIAILSPSISSKESNKKENAGAFEEMKRFGSTANIKSSPSNSASPGDTLLNNDRQGKKNWKTYIKNFQRHQKRQVPDFKMFSSPICNLRMQSAKLTSKSADHIHMTKFIPTVSPCRLSTFKQSFFQRVDELLPKFDQDDEIRDMPPGKLSNAPKPPNDKLYTILLQFSLESIYKILLKEELDIEGLALLSKADVDQIKLLNTEHKKQLVQLIEYLKKQQV